MAKEKVVRLEDKKASQVPEPCGFKLLIAIPEKEKKTEGGVLLPEDTRRREEAASLIGMVMKVGPDAYKDENRPVVQRGRFHCYEIVFWHENGYSWARVSFDK